MEENTKNSITGPEMEVFPSVQMEGGTRRSGVTIQGGLGRKGDIRMAVLMKGDTQHENNKRNGRRMEQWGLQHP